MPNRSAERTIRCPSCGQLYVAAQVASRDLGILMVDCRICGPTPWRAQLPRREPLVIDHAAIAAQRKDRARG
mgnify:CR=1 FL=1